jgi:hypothetical protein
VLASMRGSFRAVWLPSGLDAYWYAYQETGDLQWQRELILLVGRSGEQEFIGWCGWWEGNLACSLMYQKKF